jgi:prephenate dehydratase
LSAELYGLEIIEKWIQDNSKNTTRFFVVWDKEKTQWWKKTVLLFSIRNGQGVLYKCLGAFATHGIDLTKIESLPSKQDPFTYYFWVECIKTSTDPLMQEALRELAFFTKEVRVLWEI